MNNKSRMQHSNRNSNMQEERFVEVVRLYSDQQLLPANRVGQANKPAGGPANRGGQAYTPSRLQLLRRTGPITWIIASICTVFWIIVILGGLAVLIIYLVFQPKSPRFDISGVSLNGAYLDEGTLLNADVTVLANFSNPNGKVDVSFSYLQLDLNFHGVMVATQAVEPFEERRGEAVLRSVHLIASEVALPQKAAKAWQDGVAGEGVRMEVAGSFRTRLRMGRALRLRFTYWIHISCNLVVSAPPRGVLRSKHCRKRH